MSDAKSELWDWMAWPPTGKVRILAGLLLSGAALALAAAFVRTSRVDGSHQQGTGLAKQGEPTGDGSGELLVGPDEFKLHVEGVEIFGLTHLGKVRSNNQDTFRILALPQLGPDYALLLVCDGMGGHAGGEVASKVAAAMIADLIKEENLADPESLYEGLRDALRRADAAIEQKASAERELAGMGTTAVAAVVHRSGFVHCYIGDSRLYQVDGGEISYMTRDHSVVRLLLEEGIISEAEVKDHPYRSQLTSSLGGGKDANRLTIEPQWSAQESPYRTWEPGSTILLCSDGLNSELTNDEIEAVLGEGFDVAGIARTLLAKTLATGARDNITIVVGRRVS